MGAMFPGSGRFVAAVVCCLAIAAGTVRASSDPDVDKAIEALKKVDGQTQEEFARYVAALEKYADVRQKLLQGLGKLIEADQPEVDDSWDRLCDAGEKSLAELKAAAPPEKTQLQKFYEAESKTWQTLIKNNVPAAEEAESKLRKAVETITPAMSKKMQEILSEDVKIDEEIKKRAERRGKLGVVLVAAGRVINNIVNPNDLAKAMVEDLLANLELYKGALLELRLGIREKIALWKQYRQARGVATEARKLIEAGKEDMTKKGEAARSDLKVDAIRDQGAVATQAEGWAKVIDSHFAATAELVKKFEEVVDGKLTGTPSNDTKSLLGDYDYFKSQIDIWEDEAEAIEDGLDDLEKKVNEYRDGDLKKGMQETLAKCRAILKECVSLRSDIKSEFESALGDAELK